MTIAERPSRIVELPPFVFDSDSTVLDSDSIGLWFDSQVKPPAKKLYFLTGLYMSQTVEALQADRLI